MLLESRSLCSCEQEKITVMSTSPHVSVVPVVEFELCVSACIGRTNPQCSFEGRALRYVVCITL